MKVVKRFLFFIFLSKKIKTLAHKFVGRSTEVSQETELFSLSKSDVEH